MKIITSACEQNVNAVEKSEVLIFLIFITLHYC